MKYISLSHRTFHSSPILERHPSVMQFLYWEGLDWDRIWTHYAVIDPVDPRGVLYLTEREYASLLKVALSTETSILVVARPGDEPPADWSDKKIKDLSKISASTPTQFMSTKYWRSLFLPYVVTKNDSTMVRVDSKNLGRLVRGYSVNLAAYAGLKLGRTYLISVQHFISSSQTILKNHGIAEYIRRLKVTRQCLEAYLAGSRADTKALGTPIRLSKSGIPIWLPNPVRQAFISRNRPLIRVWFSILSIYRALEGIYKDPDFSPIATPQTTSLLRSAFKKYVFTFSRKNKMIYEIKKVLLPDHFPLILTGSGVASGPSIFAAPKAARIWGYQPVNHIMKWYDLLGDKQGRDMYLFLYYISAPFHSTWFKDYINKKAFLGALSLKYEAAGKVRVFAMVDYWTQTALLPLHKHLFKLLTVFKPCDCTFDQELGVRSFKDEGYDCFYSYDLKSATDMISVNYLIDILDSIFDVPIGQEWANLMIDRDFALPIQQGTKGRRYTYEGLSYIRYTRGQPMGALSSWAMLALFHHLLVQFAAFQIHGHDSYIFKKYRVLGDDVVIADREVSEQYLKLCKDLDIPISLAKSIISPPTSHKGKKGWRLFQFASQIVLGSENVSPASLREEVSANTCSSRIELIARLLDRDWKRPHIKTISFYLKSLVPRLWYQAGPMMSKGLRPLFVTALLPILLSPAVKDCGITGLSKYLIWYRTLRNTYNFADILNHMFWDPQNKTQEYYSFLNFMSERASNLYAEIMATQSLNEWNQQLNEAKRFGYEQVQNMLHNFLPKVEKGFLLDFTTLNYMIPKRPYSCPYSIPDTKDVKYLQTEATFPLYTYSELNERTKILEDHPININLMNVPLVCAAREQYLDRLGRDIRPLFNHSVHTKMSWLLDIRITSDILQQDKTRPMVKGAWMLDPTMKRTRDFLTDMSLRPWNYDHKVLDMPLWLPIFKGKVFSLATKDEFFTFGKVKSRDPDWDLKDSLVAEPNDPVTIPATFERLDQLARFLVLVDRMNPRQLFRREFLKDDKPHARKASVLSRDILKHITSFKKYDSNLKTLLLSKGGIVPGFPGV